MNSKDACLLRSVLDTRMRTTGEAKFPDYSYRGQEKRIPSLDTGIGVATAAPMKVYTGTKMLGISQMSKSNAIPVFDSDHIIEIARMRR